MELIIQDMGGVFRMGSSVVINLGIRVEIPRDAQTTKETLVQARESALQSQRWVSGAYVGAFIALSLLNCLCYLTEALVGGLWTCRPNLRDAENYFLEQGLAAAQSFVCSAQGICLLAGIIIGGIDLNRIQTQPTQEEAPRAQPTQAEAPQGQPIQVGPFQTELMYPSWAHHPVGNQEIFDRWLQGLFENLPQGLIANLLDQDPSPLPQELSPNELQGRLRELLQRHLPKYLQHIVLSMLRHPATKCIRQNSMVNLCDNLRDVRLVQGLIQDALSEILQDWLLGPPIEPLLHLLQAPHLQDSDEGLQQNDFQRQVQDQLPVLCQTLFRAARLRLFQPLSEEYLAVDALQNRFQDRIQNHFQRRLRELQLNQLHNLFRALRQKLLSFPESLSYLHISAWADELFSNRVQQLLQDDDGNLLFPNLFQDVPPQRHMCALRSNLVIDLILDILLDLVAEALPAGLPGGLQEPFLEDQLPHLYHIICSRCLHNGDNTLLQGERGSSREGLLHTLRNALGQSLNPVHLPSDLPHDQEQAPAG